METAISDRNLSTILASPSNRCPADARRDATTISSLLERYADRFEVNCSLLKQNLSSVSKLTSSTQIHQFVNNTTSNLEQAVLNFNLKYRPFVPT